MITLYKVRVNNTLNKTLSGGILSKVFAEEEGTALETEEFHTTLKYGLGKYGINDYYLYSKETGNVYYANGDLLEDSQSEITPICKDGTYYMTVNAGYCTPQWSGSSGSHGSASFATLNNEDKPFIIAKGGSGGNGYRSNSTILPKNESNISSIGDNNLGLDEHLFSIDKIS